MQASIACSPHPNGVIKFKVQSYKNPTISSKPNPIFLRTKSSSNLSLQCKFQLQSPLNPSASKFQRIQGPLRCGISSNGQTADASGSGRSVREWVELAGEILSTAFPLWVTIGCVLGLVRPTSFNWVTPKLSIVGLTIIMLGMGMTLTLDDLRGALAMPKEVLSGFFLQYSVSVSLCNLYSAVYFVVPFFVYIGNFNTKVFYQFSPPAGNFKD